MNFAVCMEMGKYNMIDWINLVNEVSDVFYMADPETYELLFLNSTGMKTFGLAEGDQEARHKCYQVLQGRDSPCPFCTNALLSHNQFHVWTYTNPLVKRHYILKDKLITWKGRTARVEIAFDITAAEEERRQLQNSLDGENLVTECARLLYGVQDDSPQHHQDAEGRLQNILQKLGTFLEADRAYLFAIHGDRMSNTYEWCAPHSVPQIQSLQDMPISLLDSWQDAFQNRACMMIENLETIRDQSPEEYRVLAAQDIHSLIAAPIYLEQTLAGYVGVDNYAVDKLGNAPAILSAISYFIGAWQQQQQTIRLLRQLSYQDTLTGLGNRNQFNQDINRLSCRPNRPIGVVYLDVNGMKRINDNHGHQQGDATLQETAQLIRSLFPNDLTYRNGGDEFVVICEGITQAEFERRTRDLRLLFANLKHFTAAIGTSWSDQYQSIQGLLLDADEAMYRDKRSFYYGKNLPGRYRHEADTVLNMTKPGALQDIIDQGQLLTYYQPKVDIFTQQAVGAEALVRYALTPETMVSPVSFVPLLEESRLISIVDFHIFSSVCQTIDGWLRTGKKALPISVNFSRYTLAESNFLSRLQEVWATWQVPKHLLELEITESAETSDRFQFLEVIRQIRQLGFRVSIDDFGIKNANLALFTTMDFDVLKIDKSLITGLESNQRAQAVLAAIATICHRMQVKMVAEGVENFQQLQILRELNCDNAQGFLFSRPIPKESFETQFLPSH